MLERKLRIYFGYFPLSWLLVVAICLLLLVLTWRITPEGNLTDEARSKVHQIFAEKFGMDKLRLDGWINLGIYLCGWMLPAGLAVVGGAQLWRYWQERPSANGEADALIGQALASLPGRAVGLLGLPDNLQHYETIVLWSPRSEDYVACQAQIPPHERQYPVRGRFRLGVDGLGRYARYDVLVLLRNGTHLYLVDGFYDITKAQFSGERTGDYLLADVSEHHKDELNSRVRLLFKDGWQYEVNLLEERGARRVFSPPEAPLMTYQQAVDRLKVFCPEPSKDGAAQLPAPAVLPQLPTGAVQAPAPTYALLPRPALVERIGRFFLVFGRSEESKDEAAALKDLLVRLQGDREQAERLVEYERQKRPGHTRVTYLRGAISRLEDNNR